MDQPGRHRPVDRWRRDHVDRDSVDRQGPTRGQRTAEETRCAGEVDAKHNQGADRPDHQQGPRHRRGLLGSPGSITSVQ